MSEDLGLGFEGNDRRKTTKQRRRRRPREFRATTKDLGEGKSFDAFDSENSSFRSKERYWTQRIQSEIHPLTINKRRSTRTSSLDLNSHNASVLSPQFLVGGTPGVKKSPLTPSYQKGWSSERVPLPINGQQRNLRNGKVLPSKWEDAERWIGSPVAVDGTGRLVLPSYYRQPMSKSGPLGPHSPLVPCFDSGGVVNFPVSAPLLTGVLVTDQQCYGRVRGPNGGCQSLRYNPPNVESYISQQSTSLQGWSDLSSQGTAQDEKIDSIKSSAIVSPKVSHKDMATQMSPAGSSSCSQDKIDVPCVPLSDDPSVQLEARSSELEIRDVQVDGEVTLTRCPKKHVPSDRCLRNIIEWKNKPGKDKDSVWKIVEPSKLSSKLAREEARIKAWRNLQEAKAEAAIQELEMRLEKERSSSMEKILNKLRSDRRTKENKCCSVHAPQASEACETERTRRTTSCLLRSCQMNFLTRCFTCHASQ